MTPRVRVRVCGEVQGVGFRHAARRHAAKLGFAVEAVNTPDGCVEITADAPLELVQELVARLSRLRTARIDSVEYRVEGGGA